MKTPAPDHEEHDPLSAALQRDAARIQEPPFDPALHYATLRRVRAMAHSETTRPRWWGPAFAGAAVLALVAVWLPRASQNIAHHAPPPQPDFDALLASSEAAVARLPTDAPSPLPAWMSPTASLLEPPAF